MKRRSATESERIVAMVFMSYTGRSLSMARASARTDSAIADGSPATFNTTKGETGGFCSEVM
jgi:hypothetical protein